jgi:predicted nucleic acid-binding protein
MIVVDTNVVAYFVIPGAHTALAESLRAREIDWRVPTLFLHEWLSVLTSYVRKRLLNRDEALRAYKRGISLVRIDQSAPDALRIINLHLASGCSSYDCEFVATAENLGAKLITFDKEIVRAFPTIAVDVEQT